MGAFVFEVEEGCQIAIELDLELPILRHKSDLLDKFAEAFSSLWARAVVLQGGGEVHDFLAVELRKIRMTTRSRCSSVLQELRKNRRLGLVSALSRDLPAHSKCTSAIGDQAAVSEPNAKICF